MFETLRQSGFIEGQNLIVDWRAFADQVDRVPELAAELVEANDLSHVDNDNADGNGPSGFPGNIAAREAPRRSL